MTIHSKIIFLLCYFLFSLFLQKITANIWRLLCRIGMTDRIGHDTLTLADGSIGKLPDHLLIEIFIRVPVSEWAETSCVKKQWANMFRGECLWQAALARTFPRAAQAKRWPGPIPRGLSRRYNLMTSSFCPFVPFDLPPPPKNQHPQLLNQRNLFHHSRMCTLGTCYYIWNEFFIIKQRDKNIQVPGSLYYIYVDIWHKLGFQYMYFRICLLFFNFPFWF